MQRESESVGPLRLVQGKPQRLNVIAGPNRFGETYLAHAYFSVLLDLTEYMPFFRAENHSGGARKPKNITLWK
ncbi:hypothetical protein CCYS_02050 [Corynebacterium cystitidis DSM 20524]|uniref:Uncharacterized protein n=1 Tax=Corynebacterium cystitidis DSM 20524 TaxID=1121357 RepID=A0A1H9VGE1_9CORY|nr:hypothetical protein CCYS_02050 [Corynebacterium cystitidis DSM 20524]SES20712.1 hypothetical protein SAMN05661109_02223 [Corynebacterium cystitidis DSM 20524]SNV87940.1 Uncharacterised protein [Corynebacterium cystitidis]